MDLCAGCENNWAEETILRRLQEDSGPSVIFAAAAKIKKGPKHRYGRCKNAQAPKAFQIYLQRH